MKTTTKLALGTVFSAAVMLNSGCSSAGGGNEGGADHQVESVSGTGTTASGTPTAAPKTTAECVPTEAQLRMMTLVNEARTVARSCGDEDFESAGPLTWDCKLEQAAFNHTVDMTTHNYFAHAGSDGLHADSRIDAVGYNWRVYGENLAAGYTFEEDAIEGLLESPGHCKNIMNSKVTEFGSARIFAKDLDYISYWTHVYATPF